MILASLALAASLSASSSLEALPEAVATLAPVSTIDFVASVVQSMQPRRFDPARFDSATAEALWTLLDTATAHRIPERPLINLAYHGAARKVSGAKILSAVREHYAAMLDAREALGSDASESELDTGADAIRNGIDAKALIAIRATRPAGKAVMALVVMTDLIRQGIPIDRARDAVTAIAGATKGDEALNALQLSVAKNAARGGPGMALDALDRYVRGVVPNGTKPAAKPVTRPPIRPDAS